MHVFFIKNKVRGLGCYLVVLEQVGPFGQAWVIMLFPSVRRVFEDCRYNVSSNSYMLILRGMAGRNDYDIPEALQAITQVIGQAQQTF